MYREGGRRTRRDSEPEKDGASGAIRGGTPRPEAPRGEVGISVAMRWVIPWVTPGIERRWGFDLTPYYALVVSHIVVQLAPILIGILGAFLLLESREDRAIKALLVSPLPLSTYLWWPCCAMVLTSAALTVVEGVIIGLGLPSLPALVAIGLVGLPTAPLIALAVAGRAQPKRRHGTPETLRHHSADGSAISPNLLKTSSAL